MVFLGSVRHVACQLIRRSSENHGQVRHSNVRRRHEAAEMSLGDTPAQLMKLLTPNRADVSCSNRQWGRWTDDQHVRMSTINRRHRWCTSIQKSLAAECGVPVTSSSRLKCFISVSDFEIFWSSQIVEKFIAAPSVTHKPKMIGERY